MICDVTLVVIWLETIIHPRVHNRIPISLLSRVCVGLVVGCENARKKTPLSELGVVEAHGIEFRANIDFCDDAGKRTHILGPCRASEREAQKDFHRLNDLMGVFD